MLKDREDREWRKVIIKIIYIVPYIYPARILRPLLKQMHEFPLLWCAIRTERKTDGTDKYTCIIWQRTTWQAACSLIIGGKEEMLGEQFGQTFQHVIDSPRSIKFCITTFHTSFTLTYH